MEYGILIDPEYPPSARLSDCPTKEVKVDAIHKVTYFDRLFVLKEAIPSQYGPAVFRSGPGPSSSPGERGRRITLYENAADQNFLVERDVASAITIDPSRTISQAAIEFSSSKDRTFIAGDQTVFVPPRLIARDLPAETCLRLDFENFLPIPDKKTNSLEDALFFQEKYGNSRKEFWGAVVDIANDIDWLHGEDVASKFSKVVGDRIEEYQRYSEETWGKRVVSSFSAKFVIDSETVKSFFPLRRCNSILGLIQW